MSRPNIYSAEKEMALEILERHTELRAIPGVFNTAIATKWKDGKDTGKLSIIVYVKEKKDLKKIKMAERIPSEIEGIPVDVIEFSSPDFKLGDTAPSRLPPKVQARIAGGVKRLQSVPFKIEEEDPE